MTICIDRRIYPDDCISKSIYALADKYVIKRTILNEKEEKLFILTKGTVDDPIIEEDIIKCLNDFKLRSIIEKETHDIRTILYAKAFAECDDIAVDDLD